MPDTISEAIAKLERLQQAAIEGARAGLAAGAQSASTVLEASIYEQTPIGDRGGTHLRDTTTPSIQVTGDRAVVTERQTKMARDEGKPSDTPLAWIIQQGRRGGYEVLPGYERFAGGKMALYWPGIRGGHPIPGPTHPKEAAPDPYGERALSDAMPAIKTVLGERLREGITGRTG